MRRPLSAADIHIHTTASDGTASPRDVVDWAIANTDLRTIAICDHNTVEGALEAARYATGHDIEVVVGQEVESADGHILGLWTTDAVTPNRPADATIADIHAQGGLALAAHPFAPRWWHRHGLCRGDREVYDTSDFDGFECANSTPLLALANVRARWYMRGNRERLASTGGSDAHMLEVIGSSRTLYPGATAEDLRQAIIARTTIAHGPVWSLTRAWRYAKKVPEIRRRSAEYKAG